MKVIYHDKSGRHLAVVTSAMHLQLVGHTMSKEDLEQLPYFLHTKPPGTLIYMGLDSQGNEVYTLGRGRVFQLIRNAYLGINRVFQLNQDLVFVDLDPLAGWSIHLFDLLNQNPAEKQIRFSVLMHRGIQQALPKLPGLIREVRLKTNRGE